jgi:hypothetical protein
VGDSLQEIIYLNVMNSRFYFGMSVPLMFRMFISTLSMLYPLVLLHRIKDVANRMGQLRFHLYDKCFILTTILYNLKIKQGMPSQSNKVCEDIVRGKGLIYQKCIVST